MKISCGPSKQFAQTIAQLLENVSNLFKNAKVVNNSLESQQNKIRVQLNQLPEKEQDMINFQRRYELTSEVDCHAALAMTVCQHHRVITNGMKWSEAISTIINTVTHFFRYDGYHRQ